MTGGEGTDAGELGTLFLGAVGEYAIVLLAPDGCVVYWNPAAERLFGYRADQVIGRLAAVTYDAEDLGRGKPAHDLAGAVAAGGHPREEGWRRRADGSRFWAEVTLTAIYDADGELRGFGQIVRDVTQSRRFQKELMRRAVHDALTGLPNRTLLLDRLGKAIGRLQRYPEHVAVYFVDLDRFKAINDSLGHRVGDLVLIAVAERLRSVLRSQDTVARLSGDEFVVLCEGLHGQPGATEIAARLVNALGPPVVVAGEPVPLHASIGVVLVEGPGHEPDTVLQCADAAMYQAKRRTDHHRVGFAIYTEAAMGRPRR